MSRSRGVWVWLVMLAAAPVVVAAPPPLWEISPQSSRVGFVARQAGAEFEGQFDRFEAAIRFRPDALAESSADVMIDLASVATANEERDGLLKGADFFGTGRWPKARFQASHFAALPPDEDGLPRFSASGTLSLRDRALPIEFRFTLRSASAASPPAARELVLEGTARLSRLAFGVGQGEWEDTTWVADAVLVRVRIVAQERSSAAPSAVEGGAAPGNEGCGASG